MENSIALIVLSLILLILVVGLIFKKDFREDVLKSENENEADFRGFKLKGALFWVIYPANNSPEYANFQIIQLSTQTF